MPLLSTSRLRVVCAPRLSAGLGEGVCACRIPVLASLLALALSACSSVTDADPGQLGDADADVDGDSDSDADADVDGDGDGDVCGPGEVDCGDGCFDLSRDPRHCGGCEEGCRQGESCVSGQCACVGADCECRDGTVDCDPSDALACRNVRRDPLNCGGCGHECDAGDACLSGLCGLSVDDCDVCPEGTRCCSGNDVRACFPNDASPCD